MKMMKRGGEKDEEDVEDEEDEEGREYCTVNHP